MHSSLDFVMEATKMNWEQPDCLQFRLPKNILCRRESRPHKLWLAGKQNDEGSLHCMNVPLSKTLYIYIFIA